MEANVSAEQFRSQYLTVTTGNETWNGISVPEGDLYAWDAELTYIQEPPFFQEMSRSSLFGEHQQGEGIGAAG